MKHTIIIPVLLLGLLTALNGQFSTALATPQTVTSLNDSGAGTLRNAITLVGPGETISFALGGTITLGSALVVTRSLNIAGPAATLRVSGNHLDRVFDIASGISVNITNLTITGGESGSQVGGGIFNLGTLTLNDCIVTDNSASYGGGGGIYNGATLTLNRCIVVTNYAGSHTPGANSSGGGILNAGTLVINNCTISRNDSGLFGGGIYNSGSLTVNNTTIWNNFSYEGGGIYNAGAANLLSLVNCTIAANVGEDDGGGISQSSPQSAVIRNTIVSANTTAGSGPDVYGLMSSQGYNLISNTAGSTGWVARDLVGRDPLLGPLQDHGGGTPTMALLPGSPAIDAGADAVLDPPSNLTTDQRGRPRKSAAQVDIGAFEVGPAPLVTNNNDSGPGSLREAALIADPNEQILFAPNVVGAITLTSGEIVIAQSRNIAGPGAHVLTVSGNNVSRVFHLTGGYSQVSGLRLANGHTSGGGGGIDLESGSTVIVDKCAIHGCYAGGMGVADQGGGAIALVNEATLWLLNSTLSSNSTPYYGGGIYLFNNAGASLVNCTVSGNRTLDGSTDEAWGGGIYVVNGSTLDVRNSTIANNSSVSAGGGIWKAFNGTATLHNTLVAGNSAPSGPDCKGPFVSSGYNLIGNSGGSTGFGATGDRLNQNPQLAPLAYYGGPTMTHALFTTSPAVDAGGSGSPVTDQSGQLRPFDFPAVANAPGGNTSDIGAFEVNPPAASIALIGNSVVISWPFYYVGYTVEATTDSHLLTGWAPVPGTPTLVGDHYTLTTGITSAPTWYRLKSP